MSIRHASEESLSHITTADKSYRKSQISIPSKKVPDISNPVLAGNPVDVGTNRPFNNAAAVISVSPPTTGGAVIGYTAVSTPGSVSASSATSPITVAGLTSGTSYTFDVKATNATGSSSAATTNPVTVTSVPQAPTITSVTDVGNNQAFNNGSVSITYTPGGSGGKSVTAYTVTSSPDGLTASGSSPLVINGLRSNVAYTYTMTATNANGTSATSTASSPVTATTVPDAPVIGTATVVDATDVSLTFTPGATGGSPITSYVVASSPSIALTVVKTNNTFAISGTFLPSIFYTFTVTAVNANGSSVASAASNSIAPIPIVTDNFNRITTGSLGTTSSGTLWQAIKGIWTANNGVAQTSDAATNDTLAVVDLKSPLVTVTAVNASLGAGVAFMVQDVNNWWAAVGLENDTYTYAYTYSYTATGTGSSYAQPRTNGPYNGYTWSHGVYSPDGFHFAVYSFYTQYQYYTYFAGGTSYYYYTYTAYANPAPNSLQVTSYSLNLYRSIAGTVSTVVSSALTAISTSLKVVVSGNTVTATAYADSAQTNSVGTATTTTTPSGNLHGIILTPSTQNQGNTIGAFTAQVTG